MIQSLFIINTFGEVLIEKHWRSVLGRAVCERFWEEASACLRKEDVPPLIVTPKHYLINIFRGGVFFLCVVSGELPPLFVIELLHRIADVLRDYFGRAVDEAGIKSNFSTVYQLLDEMLDNGYPLTTFPNALKAMIAPPSLSGRLASTILGRSTVSDKLPAGTVSDMPWRRSGVKHTQNSIYFDIIEEVDVTIDNNGQLVCASVRGSVQCNTALTGVPEVVLAFNNPGSITGIALHPCVRLGRFDREKVLSFVPPDGLFELMDYRVMALPTLEVPLYCKPQITYHETGGRVNIMVGPKMSPGKKAAGEGKERETAVEDVTVTIPFPASVRSTDLNCNFGSVMYDEATKVATWHIGRLPRDRSPNLSGSIILAEHEERPEDRPVVLLDFRAPAVTLTGLRVREVSVVNQAYKLSKGMRSVVKAGTFQIRT
eukprot:PLAT6433.24.p1 GENE.PLAT6433.24~~PLAT6433.24.p1  ORF type:complete len:429 (+),score=203.18 PLAT6433.24:75-1361(+)